MVVAHNIETYFDLIKDCNTILAYSARINDLETLNQQEPGLCKADLLMAQNNVEALKHFAKQEGEKFVVEPNLPVEMVSKQQACVIRYLLVPMLYKLGLTSQAAKWGQLTFKYLFPWLEDIISKHVQTLMGNALEQHLKGITAVLLPNHIHIDKSYYRVNSKRTAYLQVSINFAS